MKYIIDIPNEMVIKSALNGLTLGIAMVETSTQKHFIVPTNIPLISYIEPQKWVPVSERLPDLDKYVLCTVNDQGEGNEVAMMCLTTSIRADDYYWTDYACEYTWELCEVFAWMPLPEPYKGEVKE